jgi:hypothetical protein
MAELRTEEADQDEAEQDGDAKRVEQPNGFSTMMACKLPPAILTMQVSMASAK